MLKYGSLIVVGTLLAAVASVYGLHRSSYCFDEWRFVSDQEMITAAIADEIKSVGRSAAYHGLPNPGEKEIPFDSVTNFEALNPNCCRILDSADKRQALVPYSQFDGLFGYYAVVVGINYNLRFLDAQGIERQRTKQSNVPVSSCGKIELEVYRRG